MGFASKPCLRIRARSASSAARIDCLKTADSCAASACVYVFKMAFIFSSEDSWATFLLKSAPCCIHQCSKEISFSVRGVFPLGGMWCSSFCSSKRRLINSLSEGLPAAIMGPSSPPARIKLGVSKRSLPFCFSALWQEIQRWVKIGFTSCA